MAHVQYLTNETAAMMAQADQAAMGEMQDPGLMAALQSGVGLPMRQTGMQQEAEMQEEEQLPGGM
jgi:hypothetical protein